MCGGVVAFGNGVTSIQFVSHIAHNWEVPPWTVGVIKARARRSSMPSVWVTPTWQ